MRAKLKLGYPAKKTLFWQPRRALLVQNGKVALDVAIDTKPEQLCEILAKFFAYTEAGIAESKKRRTTGDRISPVFQQAIVSWQ